jgi:DNA-binding transcriptional ArsR family regulator
MPSASVRLPFHLPGRRLDIRAARGLLNHMVYHQQAALDRVFGALADPTRREIVRRLASVPEMPLTELAAPFRMSLPAVSKHVAVLERARLVRRIRRGRVRYCRVDPARLAAAASWLDTYRPFWEHQLDRLEDYLADRPSPRRSQ